MLADEVGMGKTYVALAAAYSRFGVDQAALDTRAEPFAGRLRSPRRPWPEPLPGPQRRGSPSVPRPPD